MSSEKEWRREDEEVEIVGEYDPEVEELVREAKSSQSYFNNPEESSETHTEQILRMERDPVMSHVTSADPEKFDRFQVDDEEFERRARCVERSLDELGVEYMHLEIGEPTYERLVEDGEIDDDEVSVFYISGAEAGNILGDMDRPDTEGIETDVIIGYGESGYRDTVPIEMEDQDMDGLDISAPAVRIYERNNESGMEEF
jgi:hypothetical protein